MRILMMLALLLLTGCGSDVWNQAATPAPSGVSAAGNNGDTRFGGAERPFSARGSERTIGLGR